MILTLIGSGLLLMAGLASAAVPQLSAASIMFPKDEPFLLFGEGLDDATLGIHGNAFRTDNSNWNAAESLQRLLDGKITPPVQPPPDSLTLKISVADLRTAAIRPSPGDRNDLKMLWATTREGISKPLSVNLPQIYTTRPLLPNPGDQVKLFGINFGTREPFTAVLVDPKGHFISCETGLNYSRECAIRLGFERTFLIPVDLKPSSYQLYVNSGGGDYGWSTPFLIEIRSIPSAQPVFHCEDAPSDGVTDASPAIQKTIHQASAAGGGIIVLTAGNFLIKKTIVLEPGVTLCGAGKNATTLIAPRNQQIPTIFRNYRPVVKMVDRTSLEQLRVDATPGLGHHGVLVQSATDASLRHCEITNLTQSFRPAGKSVSGDNVVSVVHNAFRLVVEDCTLRGEYPFCHWGGEMSELTFRNNTCIGLPAQGATVGIHGLRCGVIEHNRISGGGRGLTISGEAIHSYFGSNLIDNIHGINNGTEMFLYEMGHTLWQGSPTSLDEIRFTTANMKWNPTSLISSADGFRFTAYALITAGRGLGQCIPISSATGDQVTLTRPWKLMPDTSSHIVVMHGCMENIHVENQFRDGGSYSGIFGAGARNIWAGEEFENVSMGMVLWSLGTETPICLNVIRDFRIKNRAGVALIATVDTKQPILSPVLFGNEIRTCQIYDRGRNAGGAYALGQRSWRWPYNEMPPGNAPLPTFGNEAGIHLSITDGWPGNHSDEEPSLDAIPAGSWNFIWDSLVARSPLGLRIGKGFEKTAVLDLYSQFNERSVSDSGNQTFSQGLHNQTK